ncbi:hypothetical protein HYX18_00355 [Candidatus Woesearchaeota archaeon]|nr:hypothetical protein [Candidatus Woesearchaeota archaeon]
MYQLVIKSNKDYTTQYAQISDGFKDIDPNAKDLETFQKYSIKFFDQAKDIEIVKIEEKLNDGKTASVDYTINILLKDGTKKPFSSTYTLKLREKGWKLIHPYGDNIDNS